MKKVRLQTSRVLGTGQTQQFGDVVEVDAAEAKRLIKAGQAVPARPEHETATVSAPETRGEGAR